MVRLKNRYFLCEIIFYGHDDLQRLTLPSMDGKDVLDAVKNAVEEIHGDYGLAAVISGLVVKYIKAKTNVVLIRVRREVNKILWTSLPFIKMIAKCDCMVKTLHIGGTIRSCQKSLLKYNRQQLPLLLKQCKTPEERQCVKDAINKCSLVDSKGDFLHRYYEDQDIDDSDSDHGSE